MTTATLPRRSEIPVEFTWNLESMYANNDLWQKDFEWVGERLPGIEAYRGHLSESAKMLFGALKMQDEVGTKLESLAVYAQMRKDEDNTNSTYVAMADRSMSLWAQFAGSTSFITPEILEIPDEKLNSFLQEEPNLRLYEHYIQQILREKAHIRSAEVEEVLAQSLEVGMGPGNIYNMFTNADLKFPTIKDADGNEVEVTKGRFIDFMESSDRRVRRDAYEVFYDTFGRYSNTIGSTYAASVKKDIFYARTHNYKSALEAALSPENIPLEVYDSLVETVNRNLGLLHRYLHLRKKLLGVEDLRPYDLYTPLIPQARKKFTYQEATDTVLQGLSVLGEDYVQEVGKGIKSRWIDVYENIGKTSGAYSSGSFTSQPFILMNYQDNLDSVFTLAHELGHSLHSLYTNRTQPFIYANYSLFVAEVASTTNEALLTHYLLGKTTDKEVRLYLINNELEKFRGTLYRQTLFAEFERVAHTMVEEGQALTPEKLNELYSDLIKRYYGPDLLVDDRISMEWMRIPHFYRAYYVYQYATGISAATALSQQMIQEGEPAVKRYRKFLTTGSSDYPTNLLAQAGVDMTHPEPVQLALDYFNELLSEMERLTA
ncbi:MAG TPA: oligoendopeptidase F [Chloroflexia bacterium]|nr:oligoendopeptidase F [Chloroflexia bacterium]